MIATLNVCACNYIKDSFTDHTKKKLSWKLSGLITTFSIKSLLPINSIYHINSIDNNTDITTILQTHKINIFICFTKCIEKTSGIIPFGKAVFVMH